jgi:biotin-dependent carboxylase-like uncharacterized protein
LPPGETAEIVGGCIEVTSSGLLTTVQDRGRPGHARYGVSACGAADEVALRLGNRLVGNADGAAALEQTLTGGTYRFDAPVRIALAGADMDAECDGAPLPPWTTRAAGPGSVLSCRAARRGARSYLCAAGGIAVPPVLGSRSTHLRSGLGGLSGRALRRGDRLPLGVAPANDAALDAPAARLSEDAVRRLDTPGPIRVTLGAQSGRFAPGALERLLGEGISVSATSDRMGLRLAGVRLNPPDEGRMPSEGVPLGAIQIPPGGEPLLLFVDHQTTGGYPVLAAVIRADLWRVGQLRPGERIRFALVAMEEARRLAREQEAWVRSPDLVVDG